MSNTERNLEELVKKSQFQEVVESFPFGKFIWNHPKMVKEYFKKGVYSSFVLTGFKVPIEMEMFSEMSIQDNIVLNTGLSAALVTTYGPYLLKEIEKPNRRGVKQIENLLKNNYVRSGVEFLGGVVVGSSAKLFAYTVLDGRSVDESLPVSLAVGVALGFLSRVMSEYGNHTNQKRALAAAALGCIAIGYGINTDKWEKEYFSSEKKEVHYEPKVSTEVYRGLVSHEQ
jgi:hypothetical protein